MLELEAGVQGIVTFPVRPHAVSSYKKILISQTLSYLNLPKQQQEQTEIGTLH